MAVKQSTVEAASRAVSRSVSPGVLYGFGSAIGYAAANVFLKAADDVNPFWVSCVKTIPMLLLVGPWLLAMGLRRQQIWPAAGNLAGLAGSALVCHLLGNVGFQWSLGVVGIAMAVPLTMGSLIVASAVFSRFLLGEPLTPRAAVANLVLIVAIAILSLGAPEASQALVGASEHSPALFAQGVAAACLAGVAYSVLGIAIRHNAKHRTPLPTTLFLVSLIGLLLLAPLSWQQIGWSGLQATTRREWWMMSLAGICNALAFLSLAKALQDANVILVNSLNASQVAMCAIAGVVLFGEPRSAPLMIGVSVTTIGLLLMRPRSAPAQLE